MADAPDDAVGQQAGQPPVNGNVGLAQDHRQFRRVHEGHPAEVMEQFLVGDAHVSSVADGGSGGQQEGVSNWCVIRVADASETMNGHRTPSGDALRRLHQVLFQPTKEELVVPAKLKVMACGRSQPRRRHRAHRRARSLGPEVEYAYRAGYDSRGRVSVPHLVDERGLGRDGAAGAWMIPGGLLRPPHRTERATFTASGSPSDE